jgi:hypothetical protein
VAGLALVEDELLEAPGHRVEGRRETADLVRSAVHHPPPEVASGDGVGGGCDGAYAPRDATTQRRGGEHGSGERKEEGGGGPGTPALQRSQPLPQKLRLGVRQRDPELMYGGKRAGERLSPGRFVGGFVEGFQRRALRRDQSAQSAGAAARRGLRATADGRTDRSLGALHVEL